MGQILCLKKVPFANPVAYVEIDLPNLLRISLLGGAAFPIAPSGSARLLPDY